jgi:hypothetical protein
MKLSEIDESVVNEFSFLKNLFSKGDSAQSPSPSTPAYTGIDPIVRQRMGMAPATAAEIGKYTQANPPGIRAGDGYLKTNTGISMDPKNPNATTPLGVVSGGQMDVIDAAKKAANYKPEPSVQLNPPKPATSVPPAVTAPPAPAKAPVAPYTGADPIVRQRLGMEPAKPWELTMPQRNAAGTASLAWSPNAVPHIKSGSGDEWTDSQNKPIQPGGAQDVARDAFRATGAGWDPGSGVFTDTKIGSVSPKQPPDEWWNDFDNPDSVKKESLKRILQLSGTKK